MKKGFTLIELLIGVAIFSLVLGAGSRIFISGLQNQEKALMSQEILSQASYVIEYTGRALRMAKKDLNGECISPKMNYEKTDSRVLSGKTYFGPGLKFLNYKDVCQEFFLDTNDNQFKESKDELAPLPLTSAKLKVDSFNIGSDESWDQNDDLQPRVTLFFNITAETEKYSVAPGIKIQTTVSQRNPDIRR